MPVLLANRAGDVCNDKDLQVFFSLESVPGLATFASFWYIDV